MTGKTGCSNTPEQELVAITDYRSKRGEGLKNGDLDSTWSWHNHLLAEIDDCPLWTLGCLVTWPRWLTEGGWWWSAERCHPIQLPADYLPHQGNIEYLVWHHSRQHEGQHLGTERTHTRCATHHHRLTTHLSLRSQTKKNLATAWKPQILMWFRIVSLFIVSMIFLLYIFESILSLQYLFVPSPSGLAAGLWPECTKETGTVSLDNKKRKKESFCKIATSVLIPSG